MRLDRSDTVAALSQPGAVLAKWPGIACDQPPYRDVRAAPVGVRDGDPAETLR